jgi:hypothetical protein
MLRGKNMSATRRACIVVGLLLIVSIGSACDSDDSEGSGGAGPSSSSTSSTSSTSMGTGGTPGTGGSGGVGTGAQGGGGSSQLPVVTIVTPTDGQTFPANSNIAVSGTAVDPQGSTSLDYKWYVSGIADPVAYDASAQTQIAETGDYTLRLTATDPDGNTGEASVGVTITP